MASELRMASLMLRQIAAMRQKESWALRLAPLEIDEYDISPN